MIKIVDTNRFKIIVFFLINFSWDIHFLEFAPIFIETAAFAVLKLTSLWW